VVFPLLNEKAELLPVAPKKTEVYFAYRIGLFLEGLGITTGYHGYREIPGGYRAN
jgi:hypothetical protein